MRTLNKTAFYTTRDKPFIGTINPKALGLPALRKNTKITPHQKLSDLTMKADELRTDITLIQENLDKMYNSEKPSPFCTFKKWLIEYEERLLSREKELNVFFNHLTNFRKDSDPTFVEVDASYEKRPHFDPIFYSLLVSNQQRNFFSKNDIIKQNNELKILIYEQQEAISKLKARLKIFEEFKNKNAVKYALKSLNNGEIPFALAGAAPTRAVELREKQKLLSKELTQLVRRRKKTLIKYKEKQINVRKQRMLNAMALKIQNVFRGYLSRKYIEHINNSAVIIQKHVRGFLVRLKQREALEIIELEERRLNRIESNQNSQVLDNCIDKIKTDDENLLI